MWGVACVRVRMHAQVASTVAELLPVGGQVYMVSDYFEIASDMRALFLATGTAAAPPPPSVTLFLSLLSSSLMHILAFSPGQEFLLRTSHLPMCLPPHLCLHHHSSPTCSIRNMPANCEA